MWLEPVLAHDLGHQYGSLRLLAPLRRLGIADDDAFDLSATAAPSGG